MHQILSSWPRTFEMPSHRSAEEQHAHPSETLSEAGDVGAFSQAWPRSPSQFPVLLFLLTALLARATAGRSLGGGGGGDDGDTHGRKDVVGSFPLGC